LVHHIDTAKSTTAILKTIKGQKNNKISGMYPTVNGLNFIIISYLFIKDSFETEDPN